MLRQIFFFLLAMCAVILLVHANEPAGRILSPAEHRREAERTFLTFPEWFLVHSSAEYAEYVQTHTPTEFPFWGHIRQFWSSYRAVCRAGERYPFNFGHHVTIAMMGTSTTIEYGLRSTYETLIGRVSELGRSHGPTEEERLAADVAQDYVDFVRGRPWYEYDFFAKLKQLWTQTRWWGPDPVRKWERKYALTTEYAAKAIYGWLIGKARRADDDAPLPVTAVLIDMHSAVVGKGQPLLSATGVSAGLSELKVLQQLPGDEWWVVLPRYDAFTAYASRLAKEGAEFVEIAGNRSVILASVLVPRQWHAGGDEKILFAQPILTRPDQKRVVLVVPVHSLGKALRRYDPRVVKWEHIYDY